MGQTNRFVTLAPGGGTTLAFDGIDDSVGLRAPNVPGLAPAWTAECWVNRQNASDTSAALLGDNLTALKLEQPGANRRVGYTKFGVQDVSFNYTAPSSNWVHLAFVNDASAIWLYVNGTLQDSNTALASTFSLSLRQLGARATTGDGWGTADRMKGQIDEVRIWNVPAQPMTSPRPCMRH